MTRKLKVFVVGHDGRNTRMVAATSRKAAAAMMDVTLCRLSDYGSVTGNQHDIEVAMTEPIGPWEKPVWGTHEWKRLEGR